MLEAEFTILRMLDFMSRAGVLTNLNLEGCTREIQQQLETWESSQHAQDSVPAIHSENNLHH
jgi:hypothetical protein